MILHILKTWRKRQNLELVWRFRGPVMPTWCVWHINPTGLKNLELISSNPQSLKQPPGLHDSKLVSLPKRPLPSYNSALLRCTAHFLSLEEGQSLSGRGCLQLLANACFKRASHQKETSGWWLNLDPKSLSPKWLRIWCPVFHGKYGHLKGIMNLPREVST